MDSQGKEDAWQGGGWQTRLSHIRINQEGQLGSETDHTTQGSSVGKESLKTSGCKNLWGLWQEEKLPASQESSFIGETHSVLEHT